MPRLVLVDAFSLVHRARLREALARRDLLEVIDSDELNNDQANPTVTMQHLNRYAMDFVVLASGQETSSSITAPAGVQVEDGEAQPGKGRWYFARSTHARTADQTIGWTIISDDVALAAITLAEVITRNPAIMGDVGLVT